MVRQIWGLEAKGVIPMVFLVSQLTHLDRRFTGRSPLISSQSDRLKHQHFHHTSDRPQQTNNIKQRSHNQLTFSIRYVH